MHRLTAIAELDQAERRVARALRELGELGDLDGPEGQALWQLRVHLVCAQGSHARARQALKDTGRDCAR